MIPIVVDTNVLVAALLAPRGSNMAALRKVVGNATQFELCYSSQMMAEYEDVLSRPIITMRGLEQEASALREIVRRVGTELVPQYIGHVVYPDRKDKPFLEAAVYAKGIILTNNLKDFPFIGVTAIGPESFLAWCEERGIG